MSRKKPPPSLLPLLDGRALDFIKLAAVLCMVVDHMNALWFGGEIAEMRFIGRAAMPLFCYGVAAAVRRGGEDGTGRYVTRLLLAALLTEPVSQFVRGDAPASVLFTLAFGALVAGIMRGAGTGRVAACYALAAAAALLPGTMEFGLVGVALPLAILRVMDGRARELPFLLLLLALLNQSAVWSLLQQDAGAGWLGVSLLYSLVATTVLPYTVLMVSSDFVPRNGRWTSKYFLYVFYPAHLLVLWALGRVFF